jgi:hypothetical protein
MEKIDILCSPNNYYFVVDTGELFVSINELSAFGLMGKSNGDALWVQKDNMRLLSYSVGLPLGFEFIYDFVDNFASHTPARFNLKYVNPVGGAVVPFVDEFTGTFVYKENYEHQLDVYVPVSDSILAWANFMLGGTIDTPWPKISMVGVDASLNGVVFYIPLFIKVLHNFDLIGLP